MCAILTISQIGKQMVNRIQNLFLQLTLACTIFISYIFSTVADDKHEKFLFSIVKQDAELVNEIKTEFSLSSKLALLAFAFEQYKNKRIDFIELLPLSNQTDTNNNSELKADKKSLYGLIYAIIYDSSDAATKELQNFLTIKFPTFDIEFKEYINGMLINRNNEHSFSSFDLIKIQEKMLLNYPEYKHLLYVKNLSVQGIEEENPNLFEMNKGQKIIITSKTKIGNNWYCSFHNTSAANSMSGMIQIHADFIDADDLFASIVAKIHEIKNDYKLVKLFTKDQLIISHSLPNEHKIELYAPDNLVVMLKNSINVKALVAKVHLVANDEKSLQADLIVTIPGGLDQIFKLEARPDLKTN